MHVSIMLLQNGGNVWGIDNLNDYYSVSLKKARLSRIFDQVQEGNNSFNFFEEDIVGFDWKRIEGSMDIVVHLAAQAGVRYGLESPISYVHSNLSGFQSIIDYVTSHNIEKFIYASSSSVYGSKAEEPFDEGDLKLFPDSLYAATKRSNELIAIAYWNTKQVSSIGLRFFTVYGPWGRPDMAPILFTKSALTNQKVDVFNYGKQKRDFTHIDDIVAGIRLILNANNVPRGASLLNIGKGSPDTLADFIRNIEESTGKSMLLNYVEAQKGDVVSTFASLERLKSIVKYSPQIELKDGIKSVVDWYKMYNHLIK